MSTLAVLHIGTKKTGTTYLQNLLINNQQVLDGAGWTYPDFLERRNHLEIALPFAANKETEIHTSLKLKTPEANAELLARFSEQLSDSVKPGGRWLFSSEFFASRLKTEAEVSACVEYLRKHFDEVKVVVYYRRPEFMVPSVYSQSVKEGLSRDLDMGYIERHRNDFAHLELLNRWRNVVGPENVIARPYLEWFRKDSQAMVADFCAAVGIEPQSAWIEPPESASNRSLGTDGLQVLRTMNFYFPRSGPTYSRPLTQQRAAVARRVQATVTGGGRVGLTEAMTAALLAKFEPNNKALFAQVSGAGWDEWLSQPAPKPVGPMPITMTNAEIAEAMFGIVGPEEEISAAFVAQIIARLAKPTGVVDWNDPTGHPDLDGWRRKARTARTKVRRAIKRK